MDRAVFINHLPLGSASNYRQAGFAKYLRAQGYRSELIGRAPKARASKARTGRLEAEPAFEETFFWKEPMASRFIPNLSLLSGEAKGAEIVHVNRASPYTATLLSLRRRPRGSALVVDMEDWDGYGGYSSYARKLGIRGWLLSAYESWFPRSADTVLVVSHLLRSHMLAMGIPEGKLFVIPNGFDEDLFHPDIDGKGIREQYRLGDSPVVMYSSALWSFERELHEVALGAFRIASQDFPDAKLLLTGAGDLDVKTMAKELGLGDRVVTTGFVPREQIPRLMAASDVALHVISYHPFHQASSPMIIPEYMAMGKPIVAPRSGEIGTMLADGAGLPVDGLDPSVIASSLVRLLRDESLRRELGQKAAVRAKAMYSYRVLAARLRDAYEAARMARSDGGRNSL